MGARTEVATKTAKRPAQPENCESFGIELHEPYVSTSSLWVCVCVWGGGGLRHKFEDTSSGTRLNFVSLRATAVCIFYEINRVLGPCRRFPDPI